VDPDRLADQVLVGGQDERHSLHRQEQLDGLQRRHDRRRQAAVEIINQDDDLSNAVGLHQQRLERLPEARHALSAGRTLRISRVGFCLLRLGRQRLDEPLEVRRHRHRARHQDLRDPPPGDAPSQVTEPRHQLLALRRLDVRG
jgi:hypothetical protein